MTLKEFILLSESKSEKALTAGLKVRLIDRFNKDANVTLDELKDIADDEGKPFEEMVEAVCDILQEILYRRKDVREHTVDPEQLEMGIKHEMEHTKNKKIAEIIAKDHLVTIPNYYTILKEIDDD